MSQKAAAKDIVTGILSMIKELTDNDREVVYEVWKCPKVPSANAPTYLQKGACFASQTQDS
jgi:hypothetical protein